MPDKLRVAEALELFAAFYADLADRSWWRGERRSRDAAARLLISEATVKTHLMHIYSKLGVNDRAAAVAEAFDRGLLIPRHLSA